MLKNKEKPRDSEFRDEREEIAYLRQQFSSMSIRGRYKECFKLIESKLSLLYFKERWPENFYSSLLIHKRCFPSMDIDTPYDEYAAALLRKNGIPAIFVDIMRGGKQITWKGEYFREKALELQAAQKYDKALDYAELFIKSDALNSGAHLIKGLVLRDMGKYQEAVAAFERALELNKNNHQANLGLAEAYAELNPNKAMEYITAAIEQSPGEPELQAAKSRIQIKLGDLEGALATLDLANSLDPLNPVYHYQKGELYYQNKQEMAAARQYGLAVAVDEAHLPSLTRLAWLTADSQPEQALKYANTVAAANPEDVDIALLRARLLERCSDPVGAVRQYNRVVELDEGCAAAYGALGRLLLPESPERALARYQKAAELNESSARYRLGVARCQLALGDRDAALAAYQAAAERDKSCHEAYAAMGNLLMEKDPKAAMQHLNRAIALDPENPRYYRAKGELLAKGPNPSGEDILACYNQAVKYDPGDAELRVVLGGLLERIGNGASAVEHYKTAVSLDPAQEEAHHGLARLLLESDPAAALHHIDRALSLNPNRAEYYYLKSRIYSRLGGFPEAVSQLRRSLMGEAGHDDALKELAQLLDGDTPRVAMMYINRALELVPEQPIYLCERAGLLEALEDTETARAQYRKALEIDPGCHQAHFGLGRLLAGSDDKGALEHLERAEALEPANPRYTAEKALCIARDPLRYTEALDCLDEAIKKDKTRWDILLVKARLLDEHDEPLPASEHYRRVLLLDPDCLEANARMGALLADYNPRGALGYIDRAAELEPEQYKHHLWRARLLHILGQEEEAQQAVEKAVELGGESEEAYRSLAEILYPRRPAVALEYCERLIELAPQNAAYQLLRGHVLRALDKNGEAIESYHAALSLDPACHEALARIAELYYRQQNPESLGYIDQALELNGGNATYHYVRGLIREELLEDVGAAAADVQEAVRLAPGNLTYREKLVELLGKTRAPLQRFVESRKLSRLRKRLARLEDAARQGSA